jgi:hypothetical protein
MPAADSLPRITGTLTNEGNVEAVPFYGWLELMRLLESSTAARRPDTRPGWFGAAPER